MYALVYRQAVVMWGERGWLRRGILEGLLEEPGLEEGVGQMYHRPKATYNFSCNSEEQPSKHRLPLPRQACLPANSWGPLQSPGSLLASTQPGIEEASP